MVFVCAQDSNKIFNNKISLQSDEKSLYENSFKPTMGLLWGQLIGITIHNGTWSNALLRSRYVIPTASLETT